MFKTARLTLPVFMLTVLGVMAGCTGGDYPERYQSPGIGSKKPRMHAPRDYAMKPAAPQVSSAMMAQPAPSRTDVVQGPAVKVGLLLPLNGPGAEVGRVMLDAAHLALKDTRGAMASRSSPIILLPKNTQGDPQKAQKAAQEAIREGAQLILGPLFGSSLRAIAPISRQQGVPVVSFSSDKKAAGKMAYIVGFLPEQQVEKIADYAVGKGLRLFAIAAPNNVYGQMVAGQFRSAVEGRGGRVTQSLIYDPSVPDVTAQVRRLTQVMQQEKPQNDRFSRYDEAQLMAAMKADPKAEIFEAIFVPEGGTRLLQIAGALKQAGLLPEKVQLLGTGQWDDRSTAGSSLIAGGWFASAPPDRYFTFERRFFKQYGYKPARIAGLAYDTTALAATLAQHYRASGSPFSVTNLTSPAGFNGPVNGVFRLLMDGRSQRGLAVLQAGPQGFEVLERAPRYFADTAEAANAQNVAAGGNKPAAIPVALDK